MGQDKDFPNAKTMQDEDLSNAKTTQDEEPHGFKKHVVGPGLAMRMDDDPAGEGHMFTPGPDWPPARPDHPSIQGDTASKANSPAGQGHPRTSDEPKPVEGTQHEVIETSKPVDQL